MSVQKKVGLTIAASALLVAVNNLVKISLASHLSILQSVLNPNVYTLLVASIVPLLTVIRDNRPVKWTQVLIVLGVGIVATVLNPQGDLTGIVLVAFALILSVQYDLLGRVFWPQLIGSVIFYGIFVVFAAGYLFNSPLAVGFNYLIAAATFLYLFWVVFAEEVRRRRANERRLIESERRFETVIRNSNIMASNQDRELRYTWIYNPHTYLMTSDLIGKTDETLFAPDDAKRLESMKREVLSSGRGLQEEFHARIEGQDRYFDLSIEPLSDEREQIIGVNTASRDITERVVLRDRLIQSERFATAGQLATYLAHEVNSPLQGISSLIDYMQKTHSGNEDLDLNLGLIKDAFSSIKGTVNNLLDLNRPMKDRLEVVDLNEIIRNTFALTTSMLKQSRVVPTMNLSKEKLHVVGFSQRLTQVFINLINNSVEAIRRTAEANESSVSASRWIRVRSWATGSRAFVEFCDGGPGFTSEGLKHAFDPFHSKTSAIGMGVGLSICLQIIQAVGGTIAVQNGPEGGACFTIALPSARQSEIQQLHETTP